LKIVHFGRGCQKGIPVEGQGVRLGLFGRLATHDDGQVNLIGSQHTCIIGNKKLNFETIGNNEFMADQVYTENTESCP